MTRRRRRPLRLRLLEAGRQQEAFLLVLLAAVIAALTFSGALYQARIALLGALYAAVKSLAGANEWNQYGWPGNIAAWLGLLLISWVAMKAAVFAFAAQVDSLLCRTRRGHTIVCGLGERGKTLSEALLQAGETVTVLDRDEKNPFAATLRAQGARVVAADATRPESLRLVRADRARRIVAMLFADDENAAVALALQEVCGANHPLCYIHNSDTATWSSLFGSAEGRIVPFSVVDSSAVELFLEYDLSLAAEDAAVDVYGIGPLAESIIIRAAKIWQAEGVRRGKASRLPVRIIGPCTEDLATGILPMRYPGIDSLCRFTPVEIASLAVAEELVGCALGPDAACPTVAIVATGDRDETARSALLFAQWLPAECQVIAVVPSRSSLLDLLLTRDEELAGRLKAVDVSSALRDPATLLGGPREELARLAHEDWLRSQMRQGSSLTAGGPLQHWEDLPDGFKESNRHQTAALFERMLPAIGAVAVPIAEWAAEPFVFTPEQIEVLAGLEHERWCQERQGAGWILDRTLTERDAERKRTPWLVPYDELPESQKENDRDFATRIPVMLARAGFRLQCVSDGGAEATVSA